MSGFLDEFAVSIQAEYARYLDADVLGKILFKNFALNVLGVEKESLQFNLSRHGDLGTNKDPSDAEIRFGNRPYIVETKISRGIVQKRNKIDPILRWQFSGLKHSAKGTKRGKYDLVFAIGMNAPGLEDSREYWKNFVSLKKIAKKEGRDFDLSAWPHERAFLNHCGIYILPRRFIFSNCPNHYYVTVRKIRDEQFFGWGYDIPRLRNVWQHAIRVVNSPSVGDEEV